MHYCNHCRRITTGDPLFCNFCGRSYNFKLCPRQHPNPRSAEICSQCGSRELSTPQPRTPIWLSLLLALIPVLPGLLLILLSILVIVELVQALVNNQQLLLQIMLRTLPLALLWWIYLHLPSLFRKGVSKMLGRKTREGGGHGH